MCNCISECPLVTKGMICLEFPSSHYSSQTKDKPGDNCYRLESSLDQCRYCGTHGPKCAHRLQNDCVCVEWNNYSPTGGVMYMWAFALRSCHRHGQMDQPVGQTAFTGHKRGNKTVFLYLLTGYLRKCQVVIDLASFPKYFGKSKPQSKLSDFFPAQYFETRLLLGILLFLFLFSSVIRLWLLQRSGSSWGWDVTSCLALPPPLLPSSNLPHFRLSGILRFSVHHPSICPLHPYLVSPYWWKPQQTSAPLKTSNKKIDPWVTAVWPWGQWFPLKSLCVCVDNFLGSLKTGNWSNGAFY